MTKAGDYRIADGYEDTLKELLDLHERNAPLAHIRKWHLVKGDVSKTLPDWLGQNQHVVVSMAIFDMDVYKPTRDALALIKPRLTKARSWCSTS